MNIRMVGFVILGSIVKWILAVRRKSRRLERTSL